MTFDALLAQILELLQRQGRVSYGALKRRFSLDDAYLDDLKTEIIEAQRLAVDEQGRILVWTGGTGATPAPVPASPPSHLPDMPSHIAEKILTSKAALEGERKQVTVLFADLKGSMELLAARIDRLSPEDKRLLQTAAVIGTEVPLPLMQAIADVPAEALHRGLAHVQAAEFLYETRLFPEHAYTFKHALTHEVAYSSLLQERRRVLHAHIVEALERLTPDRLAEQVERLAHHALHGEVWDKALAYCRQAGEKALTPVPG